MSSFIHALHTWNVSFQVKCMAYGHAPATFKVAMMATLLVAKGIDALRK